MTKYIGAAHVYAFSFGTHRHTNEVYVESGWVWRVSRYCNISIVWLYRSTQMASRTHVQRVRTLYKTILRLHRGLPAEIQPLGNNYVRDEFKRHKNCVESEAIIFLHEWTVSRDRVDYLARLRQRLCLPCRSRRELLTRTRGLEMLARLTRYN